MKIASPNPQCQYIHPPSYTPYALPYPPQQNANLVAPSSPYPHQIGFCVTSPLPTIHQMSPQGQQIPKVPSENTISTPSK